jgi:Spy/CpxP family protein refolding chaperone
MRHQKEREMGLPYHPYLENDVREPRRPSRRKWLLLGGLAALLVVAIAAAAGARPGGFWRHGHGDPEFMRDHAAFMVERTLAHVDATPEQVEAIQALLDATIVELAALRDSHGELHAEAVEALTAEEVDRDAIEQLRREKLAEFDRASQKVVATLADVSEVLTPAQRVALAEHMAERHHRFRR